MYPLTVSPSVSGSRLFFTKQHNVTPHNSLGNPLAHPTDAPAPGTVLRRFTLGQLLGQGGFTWVYAATRDDGKSFAVKVLKPRFASDDGFARRFRQEFRFAGNLHHPNIVQVEEVGQEGGLVYFAMDLYPDTLGRRLERARVLPEDALLRVGKDVSRALAYAHGQGVIHRDIKPDNVLLAADGGAVLTDFGIARAVSDYAAATGANMTIGTPHYLSPEQAQGRVLDGRSDLYSVGITLYRAATGELPFKSRDWYELARMHVESPPLPPRTLRPDLSRRLERIILRCLAKHPNDRYPNATDLLADLEDVTAREHPTLEIRVPRGYLTPAHGQPAIPDDLPKKKAEPKQDQANVAKRWWKVW